MESWDVLIESLVSSSSLDHCLPSLEVAIVPIWANKVKVLLDVYDWNGDVLVVDAHSNILIQIILSPWSKVNRCLREKDVNLFFNFPFTDLVVLYVGAVDIVLWSS